jgi:formylglycine-generating enzyme required for sulfatase activity
MPAEKNIDSHIAGYPTLKTRKILKALMPAILIFQMAACNLGTKLAPEYVVGSTQLSKKDGMLMVFVPAGDFTMGSDYGPIDEKPVHTVSLDAFWIDQTEVTNAMFAKFVGATDYKTDAEKGGCSYVIDLPTETWNCITDAFWSQPQGAGSNLDGLEAHPVVQVSWNDAQAYCDWAGRRLPTEAEWEKAARGTDARSFPWGNDPIRDDLVNFADETYGTSWSVDQVNDGHRFTSPVGYYSRGASPYGAFDMAGNVWEWGGSLYQPYPYDARDGREDFEADGTYILRGGSWDDFDVNVRNTIRFRGATTFRVTYIGFRCASSP